MAERQSASFEPDKDTSHVAGLKATSGQTRHQRSIRPVVNDPPTTDSTRPWRRNRRPSDNGGSSVCCMPKRLLPAAATATSPTEHVSRHHQDVSSSICYMPLGLLQFAIFRHLGRADETSAVGSECSCSTGDRCATLRPHDTGASATALASG